MNDIQNVYDGKKTDDRKMAYTVIGEASATTYYENEMIVLPSPQDVDFSYVEFNNI